ncbi:MAG: hypothetical protein J5883_02185 [Clostridiales bacterium]|nr:hypothetical protein [Clostridiales bacterium]
MATGLEDAAKVAALPQEGVHCYAANSKQISVRRIVTVILMAVFAVLAVLFFVNENRQVLIGCIAVAAFIVSLLVFIQTFLIAKYRVAVDYNEKKVILRYRFSLISIPFDSFDARDGEPDKAEELLENANNSGEKTFYLVLDNVFDEACFQTSTKDLASRDDFFQLKEETFAIADAYGARNSEDAIKPNQPPKKESVDKAETSEGDVDDIVKKAIEE